MLKWNGPAALKALQVEAAKRLLKAGFFYQTYLMNAVNISNPRPYKTPSKPGEYFRKRTGWAQAHILLSASSVADVVGAGLKIKAGVPKGTEYPLILEVSPRFKRLGFLQAAKETKQQVAAIIQGP